jgi:hypothetical protein
MANTMTLIASSTVGSGGAASIDFTSIPSTYTDLQLVMSLRQNQANNNVRITINGGTTGYSERVLYGTGSGTASTSASATYFNLMYSDGSAETANTFGNLQMYIPNYAGSTNKSISVDGVYENNATAAIAALTAQLWANTAAITSISIVPASALWVQYSTAYLYGVKNA